MGLLNATKKAMNRLVAGYEAVVPSKRRKSITIDRRSEDRVLNPNDREAMVSACRDLRRNHPVVASAVRKHINYVASFRFQCHSDNDQINTLIENLMNWWSRPLNCDASGRHGLQQLFDLIEGHAVTDGDVFVLKLADGRLQLIEGDRVRTPDDFDGKPFTKDQFTHGVNVDARTAAKRYAICERVEDGMGTRGGWKLKAVIDSGDLYQHGYFERYDQLRGVPLLAPAINDFRDIGEAKGYALSKMKVGQFAAMARTLTDSGDEAENASGNVQPSDDGPQVIDLLPGESIDMIESAQPSTQFQQFMVSVKMDGLKALDQPYSFYDEKWTNYSGARNALQQYDQISNTRRDRLRLLLDALTAWRIQLWIDEGVLPADLSVQSLKWEWVSQGMPWIDPAREASANETMLRLGLASAEDLCRERGGDWYAIQEKLANEAAFRAKLGLAAPAADPSAGTDAPTNEQLDQADALAIQGEDDEQSAAA